MAALNGDGSMTSPQARIALVLAEKVVALLESSGATKDEQFSALAIARELVPLSEASGTAISLPQSSTQSAEGPC